LCRGQQPFTKQNLTLARALLGLEPSYGCAVELRSFFYGDGGRCSGSRPQANRARRRGETCVLVPAQCDDADERWRAVLFELVRRAQADNEFRARIKATGAVIDDFEAVLGRTHAPRTAPAGVIACHPYWWGFQVELTHASLAAWLPTTEWTEIAIAMGPLSGPASPFLRRAAMWIASRLDELEQLDRGAGVYASMTWMAPNIFVALPIRVA
jgi:hypothetical protein